MRSAHKVYKMLSRCTSQTMPTPPIRYIYFDPLHSDRTACAASQHPFHPLASIHQQQQPTTVMMRQAHNRPPIYNICCASCLCIWARCVFAVPMAYAYHPNFPEPMMSRIDTLMHFRGFRVPLQIDWLVVRARGGQFNELKSANTRQPPYICGMRGVTDSNPIRPLYTYIPLARSCQSFKRVETAC